ncbi:hypothetical protein GE09DRAFT_1055216 [Coniochaeta sp. 2T2.1]|nr:hypothetical protein GE09DRAFT_1055216 [Coniochaeta sp. 2T2.1]
MTCTPLLLSSPSKPNYQSLSQTSEPSTLPTPPPSFLSALFHPALLPPRPAAAAQLVLFHRFLLFQESRLFFLVPSCLLPLWDDPTAEAHQFQGARLARMLFFSQSYFVSSVARVLVDGFWGGDAWSVVLTPNRISKMDNITTGDILRVLLLIPAHHEHDGPIHLLLYNRLYAFQSRTLRIPDRLGFFYPCPEESQKKLAHWLCAYCAVAAGFFAVCAPFVVSAHLARPHAVLLGRGMAIVGGGVGFVMGLARQLQRLSLRTKEKVVSSKWYLPSKHSNASRLP